MVTDEVDLLMNVRSFVTFLKNLRMITIRESEAFIFLSVEFSQKKR